MSAHDPTTELTLGHGFELAMGGQGPSPERAKPRFQPQTGSWIPRNHRALNSKNLGDHGGVCGPTGPAAGRGAGRESVKRLKLRKLKGKGSVLWRRVVDA